MIWMQVNSQIIQKSDDVITGLQHGLHTEQKDFPQSSFIGFYC